VSEQNKAFVRAVFEVWSNGELEKLDQLLASTVVHHDPYDPHAADGLSGMEKSIKKTRNLYPDLQMTIEDQLADGDKVVTRWTATMMHNGKRVTLNGITMDRFEQGKIVEAWRSMDMLGFLKQTGGLAEDSLSSLAENSIGLSI